MSFAFTLIASTLYAQDEEITPEEIEKAREIRESLIQQGLLQTVEDVPTANVGGSVTLVDFSSYNGDNLNVATSGARGSDFSQDGSRFYILGRTSANILEYRLSDSWNVESGSYVREFSIAGEMGSRDQPDNASNGFFIRKDGRRMWVFNRTEIWEYSLSDSWNISSANQTGYRDLSGTIVRGHDFDFSPDGRFLYVDDRVQEAIYQFRLSSTWDVESASLQRVLDISSQQNAVRGIQFSPGGKRMFLNDTGRNEILEYFLSDAYNIGSASFSGAYSVSSETTSGEGFSIRHDDSSMFYVTSTSEERVYQYRISALGSGRSSVSANNGKVTANEIRSSRITVTARTPSGELIEGLEMRLNHNGDDVEIDAVNNVTNSNGEARFDVRSSDVQNVTFTARGLGTTIDQTASVEFVSLDAGESEISRNREKVIANGSGTARITVTARNEDGDRLENLEIDLDANSGSVDIDEERSRTNSDGEAIFDVSNTVAETVTFSAKSQGTTIDQTVNIRFVTVNAAQSEVRSSLQKVQANGTESSTITVIARDEDGDELEGVDISLIPDGGDSEISAQSDDTDSNGEIQFRVTNTQPEVVEYRARGAGVTIDDRVTVNFIPIDPDESNVSISRNKVLANGSAEATITVTARDEDGDAFSNTTINLSQSGGSSTITEVQPKTDGDGIAVFRIKSDETGQITYSASALGVTINTTVSAQFVTVDPAQSTVSVNPPEVQANGSEESKITVTARDSDGDDLNGARVVIEALNGNSSIDNSEKITDENGQAVFTLTNDTPEIVDYKITAEGKEFPENVSVGFIPIAPVALSATEVQTRQFRANWEVVSGAESYLIDVATDSSFNNLVNSYNALDVGNTTSALIDNVSPGTTYLYRVRATKDGLIGANSQIIQTTTFPETPQAIEATERNALKFTANWQTAEGARKYRLDVATDSDFNNKIPDYNNRDVGDAQSFTVSNLETGTNYFYRVRSEAGPRTSSSSNAIQTSTLTISPENSELTSDQLRVLANGDQTNELRITVKSESGILLEGLNVEISQKEGTSEIESIQPATDGEGVAIFGVTSTTAGKVTYQVTVAGTSLGDISVEFLADEGVLRLGNNFPNPFAEQTILPVTIPRTMSVEITVYNSLGVPVRTVIDEQMNTGYYEIPFQVNELAAGVYFYRLIADGDIKTRKMVLVK